MALVDSPDMKLARLRLEDLLSNIKEQAETPDSSEKDEKEELFDDEDDVKGSLTWKSGKRSAGSTPGKHKDEPLKKRSRHATRKILFELRQKPFELPNTTEDYSLYKMCRIWLRGKDNSQQYLSPSSSPQKQTATEIIVTGKDMRDTKEVYKMPPPLNMWEALRRVPSPLPMKELPEDFDFSSKESVLASYMPHWKSVKQRWCKHARQLEKQCYGRNLQILQNMVALSAQINDFSPS